MCTSSNSIVVFEAIEVDVQAFSEVLLAEVVRHHTDNTGALAIRDSVEDLIDISGFANIYLNRVGVAKRIDLERVSTVLRIRRYPP